MACDIHNTYHNAETKEKLYMIAGVQFGVNVGQPAIIVCVLKGFKSSDMCFCVYVANALRKMGFESCLVDPDVWLLPTVKPNGMLYYEYLAVNLFG
jgi:hypothetical protein